jgi:hypothetical protein
MTHFFFNIINHIFIVLFSSIQILYLYLFNKNILILLLQLLHIDKRREYLYQLQEFLVTDNSRNWRFRAELAE